jgi:transposase-like protein
MLSPTQRKKNIASLKAEHSRLLKLEKAKTFSNRPPCPFCGNKHIYAYGSNPGNNKRFKCAQCKKTFTKRSGTCFHYIHLRSKFQNYMNVMLSEGHKPLKKLSKDFNICVLTAFDWRHKILSAINTSEKQLQGFIELKNSIVAFSRKGIHLSKNASKNFSKRFAPVQIIVAADYNNTSAIEIARIGKLKSIDIEVSLGIKIAEKAVAISPSNTSIKEFCDKKNINLTQFQKNKNPNNLKIKKADALDIALKQLVYAKSRGVSTKYLHLYAHWAIQNTTVQTESLIADILKQTTAWSKYTNRENDYCQFLEIRSEIKHIKTAHREWKTAGNFNIQN